MMEIHDRPTGSPQETKWPLAYSSESSPVALPSWRNLKTYIIIGLACLILSAAAASFGQERLDYPITLFINRAANSVLLADITQALQLNTFMAVVPLAAIWLIWFDIPNAASRASIVAGVIGASFAAIGSRVVQLILPTHLRPLHDSALAFVAPRGADPSLLNHWNSFPSDTGSLIFGLAMVIAINRPRLGIAAFVWAALCASSRVFQGLHYPSDITGAVGLSVTIICASQHPFIRRMCLVFPRWAAERTAIFYAGAFVASYQVATLFWDVRAIASILKHG
jgi:membrane-associated phospholipid phosphatase